MNKKAMAVGQVFIFIIAGITFALVLIFGYKAVDGFLSQGEEVEFIQFRNDLQSSVKKIYTEYGSVRTEDFHPPGKYKRVCFVDLKYDKINEEMADLCRQDPNACDVWSGIQEGLYQDLNEVPNVFLTPTADNPITVHTIRLIEQGQRTGFLCKDITRGSFNLRLEGKGSYTQLSG
jgi:hypothetical protein